MKVEGNVIAKHETFPPTNMVSVVSERPRRSNHKEFAKELGKAVEPTKKYPSCPVPIGRYCSKHGVTHTSFAQKP